MCWLTLCFCSATKFAFFLTDNLNDRTYIDTETIYTNAYQTVLDPYGKTYTWSVKEQLMGSREEESARKMIEIYELPITCDEFIALVRAYNYKIMKTAELLPGNYAVN